jgi:hypothetical protein
MGSYAKCSKNIEFSLLVNDNKATGNQAARDAMVVTVTSDGPFTVTSQANRNKYNGNTSVPITWNVAGTNTGTINTQNVTILLSKDGGLTFNTVLAASVPNNGSASVMPNENVSSARIMVKAVGNIYYALNTSFSITQVVGNGRNKVKTSRFIRILLMMLLISDLKIQSQKADYSFTMLQED